ncbi:MAG: TlpA disulfide reductase family protein [bacterium]
MEKKVGLFAVIVICLGLLVYLSASGPPEHLPPPPLPQTSGGSGHSTGQGGQAQDMKAPDFTLPSLEGESYSLSALKGKPVIINFWSPSCAPCIVEMPAFQKLYESMPAESLHILAVTSGPKARAQEIKNEYDLDFPVLLDKDSRVERLYQVRSYPMTYIIGPDGKVRQAFPGAADWSHSSVIRYLKSLAGQNP